MNMKENKKMSVKQGPSYENEKQRQLEEKTKNYSNIYIYCTL